MGSGWSVQMVKVVHVRKNRAVEGCCNDSSASWKNCTLWFAIDCFKTMCSIFKELTKYQVFQIAAFRKQCLKDVVECFSQGKAENLSKLNIHLTFWLLKLVLCKNFLLVSCLSTNATCKAYKLHKIKLENIELCSYKRHEWKSKALHSCSCLSFGYNKPDLTNYDLLLVVFKSKFLFLHVNYKDKCSFKKILTIKVNTQGHETQIECFHLQFAHDTVTQNTHAGSDPLNTLSTALQVLKHRASNIFTHFPSIKILCYRRLQEELSAQMLWATWVAGCRDHT